MRELGPLTPEFLALGEKPLALEERWHIDGLQPPYSLGYSHRFIAVTTTTKNVTSYINRHENPRVQRWKMLIVSAWRCSFSRCITTDRGRAFTTEEIHESVPDPRRWIPVCRCQTTTGTWIMEKVNRFLLSVTTIVYNGNPHHWGALCNKHRISHNYLDQQK